MLNAVKQSEGHPDGEILCSDAHLCRWWNNTDGNTAKRRYSAPTNPACPSIGRYFAQSLEMRWVKYAQGEICPQCLYFLQPVDHLFNCPTRPTELVTDDLWTFPEEVAFFLSFHPSFDIPPPQRRRCGQPPPAPLPSPAPAPSLCSPPIYSFSCLCRSYCRMPLSLLFLSTRRFPK